MSYADNVYKNLVNDICANGTWDSNEDVRTRYKDGEKAYAKSLFGYQVKFPKGVVPLITTKKVFTQTAIKEMLLFWVHQTVKKEDFDNWNVKIWDSWMKEDGTLGESYAAQFQKGERNQVVELIKGIKENPKSRRLMTSFWDFENAPNKALQECAWATQWDVRNGCLNLILIQRSVDTALGLPFNWFQYSVLQHLIAHCCGLEVGEFTHQMGNVHYYDRHKVSLLEQVNYDIYVSEPKIIINESLKDFFNTKLSDITLLDYECSEENFKYDIAV